MATRKASGKKPYPDFPLFKHATGQWAKKIRGKMRYFGVDADEALKRYDEQRDALYAGRTPRPTNALTVRDLCNRFLTSKKLLLESGELSSRSWRDYYLTCGRLVEAFGGDRAIVDLEGADFDQFRAKLASTRGPVALGNEIQRTRTVLKYASDASLIERPVRFGTEFRKPSKKSVRVAKHAAGGKMIEAGDARKLVAGAGTQLKAMILLALNAGYGQSDTAALPIEAVNLKRGWVTFPRPKTAMPRRAKLWPETIAAVRNAIAARPTPKDSSDSGLVFITRFGKRWVRTRDRDGKTAVPIDSVILEFRKLMKGLGLTRKKVGFYTLRHSFRTAADGAGDQRAVDYIMGHVPQHISGTYVEHIEDKRLEAIAKHVRAWLWPKRNARKS